ncbi:hypothetical protein JCM9492_04420 [Aquifex pyrophilus]
MKNLSIKLKLLIILYLLFTFGTQAQEEERVNLPNYRPDPNIIRKVLLPPARFGKLLFDLFEYRRNSDEKEFVYDVEFWYGGDFRRLWMETEGEHSLKNGSGTVERFDIYYSQLITAFWDFRLGGGVASVYGDNSKSRTYGVVGFQGLAPYWFEVDANVRIDTEGKVSADIEVEYDLLFTQRLILQPRLETVVAFSDIEDVGIWKGVNYLELGARLRYEIRREFAPYIGISWITYLGKAKDVMEASGEDTDRFDLIFGLRMWF